MEQISFLAAPRIGAKEPRRTDYKHPRRNLLGNIMKDPLHSIRILQVSLHMQTGMIKQSREIQNFNYLLVLFQEPLLLLVPHMILMAVAEETGQLCLTYYGIPP